MAIGASRRADGTALYWRVSHFLQPNHGLAPNAFPGENYHGQTWVPITDELCWVYCYTWNPERPLTEAERQRLRAGQSVHAAVDERWVPLRNRDNEYLIDRVDQKLRTFTGIRGISEQDACIQDSQGLIADRTREHLGPTDAAIVQFRRLMSDRSLSRPDRKRLSRRTFLRAAGVTGAVALSPAVIRRAAEAQEIPSPIRPDPAAKRGGTLRYGILSAPAHFDVHQSGTVANIGAQSPM